MRTRLLLLLGLGLVGCSFPTDGVVNGDDDDTIDASQFDAEVPPDACVVMEETCEGTDQDCDGMIDEGFTSGAACDSPGDTDLCFDDMTVCDENGAEVCGNTSGDDDLELCNTTVDDDCDTLIDEDFDVGDVCDGDDGDLCNEGAYACAGDGSQVCSDGTATNVELCNLGDDDCDNSVDEGFDLQTDEANCGVCGNTCTNGFGTTSCLGGDCTPVCSNGAAQCDPDPDNGCELVDTGPTCPPGTPANDIVVSGDLATTGTFGGTTEDFVVIRITEVVSGGVDLTARIALVSGSGTDFDLFVYCTGCGNAPLSDATDDTVEVGRTDAGGPRDYTVIAEVRYDPATPSTTCAQWAVNVTTAITTTNRCAD